MDDDPVPRSFKGHTGTNKVITDTLSFKIIAPRPKVPLLNSDNDSNIKISIREIYQIHPPFKKDSTIFFNNLIFNFNTRVQNIVQFCDKLQSVQFVLRHLKRMYQLISHDHKSCIGSN
jgi:hypothetical protein